MANEDLDDWVRLDAHWLANPKVRRAGVFGRALYVAGLLWSHRQDTDGDIPADILDYLAAEAGLTMVQAQEAASKLMDGRNPMWRRTADGWHIHDYETCQETSSDREKARAATRERVRRWRERQAKSAPPTPPLGPPSNPPVTGYEDVSDVSVTAPDTDTDTDTDTDKKTLKRNAAFPSESPAISTPPTHQVPPKGGRAQVTDEGFAQFWDTYPKRDGRRIGKGPALIQWRKIPAPDRPLVLVAVAHYAAERGGPGQLSPEDAERWLRSQRWAEFADPPDEEAITAANGRRARPSIGARLAALPPPREA